MKKILIFLTIFTVIFLTRFNSVMAIAEIVATGNWSQTINASNLTSGAGSNLTSTYTSASNATMHSLTESGQVQVKRTDTNWNGNFHLYVKRTGDGTDTSGKGIGTISGGTSYQEITTSYASFYNYYLRSGIPIQYQLTGVSLAIAPGTYTTTVYYYVPTLSVSSITVTITISAIGEISVSANPSTMNVNSATAGSQPNEVTDNSTSYAVSTNQSNKKITGKVGSALPSNVTLKANLAAPAGASSAGDVSLTTSDQNLVTGINGAAASGNTITYKLSAPVSAGVVNSTSTTVTFTLTD